MKSLTDARAELDAVDSQIVRLFEQRMEISRDVARYKIANHLPVLDRSREAQVLDSRASMLADPYWEGSVRALYEAIMAISRAEQQILLDQAAQEERQ